MPPGVAAVVVEVLTGDADRNLKRLGDTAVAQAKAIEASYAKTGAVMSESMGTGTEAIDVALISSQKYAEQLARLETAQKAYATATANAAAEIKAAEDGLIAKIEEQKKAREDLTRVNTVQQRAAVQGAIASADAAVAAAEREVAAARKVAAAKEARFGGGVAAASAGVLATKVSVTREAEEQLAAQQKLEEAAGKQAAALQGLQRFGGKALLGIGVAATVVGVEAVKMGVGFENAQKKFEAFSGAGEKAGNELTSSFEHTAGRFMQSGQELEGAYAGVSRQVQVTQGHALAAGESLK